MKLKKMDYKAKNEDKGACVNWLTHRILKPLKTSVLFIIGLLRPKQTLQNKSGSTKVKPKGKPAMFKTVKQQVGKKDCKCKVCSKKATGIKHG